MTNVQTSELSSQPVTVAPARQTAIRVLIIDNQSLVRRGLREELSQLDDFVVVGEAGDGLSALQIARETQPDVVILDVMLPELNGIEVTRALRGGRQAGRKRPEVLVFTDTGDRFYALALLMAGARGYLLKSEPVSHVIDGVRELMRGGTALNPSVYATLVEWVSNYSVDLSRRELEILRLMARGLTNDDIAARLSISPATVQRHLHNSYRKLPFVRNRAEAIAWAWINGIVQVE